MSRWISRYDAPLHQLAPDRPGYRAIEHDAAAAVAARLEALSAEMVQPD